MSMNPKNKCDDEENQRVFGIWFYTRVNAENEKDARAKAIEKAHDCLDQSWVDSTEDCGSVR